MEQPSIPRNCIATSLPPRCCLRFHPQGANTVTMLATAASEATFGRFGNGSVLQSERGPRHRNYLTFLQPRLVAPGKNRRRHGKRHDGRTGWQAVHRPQGLRRAALHSHLYEGAVGRAAWAHPQAHCSALVDRWAPRLTASAARSLRPRSCRRFRNDHLHGQPGLFPDPQRAHDRPERIAPGHLRHPGRREQFLRSFRSSVDLQLVFSPNVLLIASLEPGPSHLSAQDGESRKLG